MERESFIFYRSFYDSIKGLGGRGICRMYAFSVRIWAEWSGADRRHTGGGGFEDGEAADRCE